jgi:thiamine pyrophosphate-dependent acetolactate synthase large subunit-like protein
MKVYEAVADAFIREGTTTVFGVLGDGQLPWWDAMSKRPGIEIIDARDEGGSLSMAEGWARATGKVGVCSVTHGPGVARLTNSLITISRSHIPVVVYTSKTPFNNDTASQYLDQDRLVSATGAGYIEVLKPEYAQTAARMAFYRAKLESRPYVLCVPRDIQQKECDSEGDDYEPSSSLFAGQQKIQPDAERLRAAIDIIKAAKKPVLLLGRGASSRESVAVAERLAQRIGALLTTSLLGRGVIGDSEYYAGISGLYSTRAAMHCFEEADCVVAFGAGLNERTLEGGYLYPKARIIHVDVARHVLMGNLKSADCYIQADAGVTLQAIDDAVAKLGHQQVGYRTPEVKKALRDGRYDRTEYEIEPGVVDPREVARLLDEKLPVEVPLISASGHCITIATMEMHKARPLQAVVNSHWGSIGQGMAAAIGVGVAMKSKPVLHMEGDGGAMQNIQELDTAGRTQVKVLFVILNDEGFGAEYHKLKAHHKDTKISLYRAPDFAAAARAFGCGGATARTLDEVSAAVDKFMAGSGPMLIDVRISRNVISIPYRRQLYAADV